MVSDVVYISCQMKRDVRMSLRIENNKIEDDNEQADDEDDDEAR